jgi:hypothetical protein
MQMTRTNKGAWERLDDRVEGENHFYNDALVRYFNYLDPVFAHAREKNHFEFLMTLFRPRGLEDAGWDPFQSTREAMVSVIESHRNIKGSAQRHLELWLYGHILEASEPYEILANLFAVLDGDTFNTNRFPPHANGRDKSPGEKIDHLKYLAAKAKLPEACIPLTEIWNKNLRNSIFHADYALYGSEVRTKKPLKIYSHEDIATLSNRAVAYFEVLGNLYDMHIASYKEPSIIHAPEYFSAFPKAVVLVSEGHGAVGLQAAASTEDIKAGVIVWRLGIFTPAERESLDRDPTRWLLPGTDRK